MARRTACPQRLHAESRPRMAYSSGDSAPSDNDPRMTLLRRPRTSPASRDAAHVRIWCRSPSGPRSRPVRSRWLPISCGRPGNRSRQRAGTPSGAGRRHAVQRSDGFGSPQGSAPYRPQERVDLAFTFPALEPPEAPKHVSADTVEDQQQQPIDRNFVSIARITTRWHQTCACARSIRAISSRARRSSNDGLSMRTFKEGSPTPARTCSQQPTRAISALHARCGHPGMCLSERRIEGAI